jgi:hypothetical protein
MGDRLGIPGAVDFFVLHFVVFFFFPELTFAILYIIYKIFVSNVIVSVIYFIKILINQHNCVLILDAAFMTADLISNVASAAFMTAY